MAVPSGSNLKAPVRILIVDDHPTVREGLRGSIARHVDMSVCGEAAAEAEALRQADALHPDLVIIDLSLREGNGLSLIKRLRAKGDLMKILVHSMFAESLYAERALLAGADGYVGKEADPGQVIQALRRVLAGEVYLSEELKQRVLARSTGGGRRLGGDPVARLSNRELEILGLIGQGMTSSQIARRLHISAHTVDSHRENLKVKLGMQNSAQLVCFAARWTLENT